MAENQWNQPGESPLGHNSTRLEEIPVAALCAAPGDPWRQKDPDIERAMNVLRDAPARVPLPIVVNDELEVLVGGIFVEAARKLGIKTLLVVRHAGLTKLEQKQYSIAINRLLACGEWDPAAFEIWLRELEDGVEDFSHASIGFSNGELDQILGMADEIAGGGADEVPPWQPAAVSQLGTVWKAGKHRVSVGDSTKAADVARAMGGHTAAAAFTDPPFGCKVDGFVSAKGKHREFVEGSGIPPDEMFLLFLAFAKALAPILRAGALVYVFIDWRSLSILQRALEEVFGPLVQFCCWVKNRKGMGSFYRSQHELILVHRMPGGPHTNNVQLGRYGRNRSNVWDYPSAASSRNGREGDMLKNHPTPKPVELVADALLDCTAHGDRVIDCFLGSGTTLIAAERTGRICHGMDLDPLYVDVAIRRWQAWTGLDAIDSESGRTFNQIADDMTQGGDDNG